MRWSPKSSEKMVWLKKGTQTKERKGPSMEFKGRATFKRQAAKE